MRLKTAEIFFDHTCAAGDAFCLFFSLRQKITRVQQRTKYTCGLQQLEMYAAAEAHLHGCVITLIARKRRQEFCTADLIPEKAANL